MTKYDRRMVKYSPVWSGMVPYGPVPIFPNGPIWSCMVRNAPVWSCMVRYGPVWSHMVTYAPLCSFMLPYAPVWSCMRLTMIKYFQNMLKKFLLCLILCTYAKILCLFNEQQQK